MEEVLATVMEFLVSASGQATLIAVALEFAFRMVPTAKPLSAAHAVAKIAKSAGNVLVKTAELLDKVLPQNVTAKK